MRWIVWFFLLVATVFTLADAVDRQVTSFDGTEVLEKNFTQHAS